MFMKTLIFILFASLSAQAQNFRYEPKTESATFMAPDSLSVNESFRFLKKLIPEGFCAHHRYVIKDGKTYMREYHNHNTVFRMTAMKVFLVTVMTVVLMAEIEKEREM